jgi:uncharacterized protein
MRYVFCPGRDGAEASWLASSYGRTYAPFGSLSLHPDVQLTTDGVDLVSLEGETLAIHPESASWAFLTRAEVDIFRRLTGMKFRDLAARMGDADLALDFAAHLWRRGLLSLGRRRAVDESMFTDGPNYDEGHLVELLLTEKCNLACPYCLAGANQKMPAMDDAIAFRSVDLAFAMPEAKVLAFEFAGGEPFLKYDLMKRLVAYIRSHPGARTRTVFLSIQTNCTLITEERVKWLRDNDIRVGISLDGGAQAQNRSRPQVNGKESFSKLMQGIELLKAGGISFGGLVVLNRANIGNPDELAQFMLDHRIHGFRINPVAYLGEARRNWSAVGLEQDEIIAFFKAFLSGIVRRGDVILENNVNSMCRFLTSKQRRTRCMRAECGAGDTFQSVAANGDIYPCGRATQSPGLRLGNIFDDGVASLSAPARVSERIAELRTRRPRDFDDCARCSYRQLCQAGCSAQAWERYGTIRHKTPECAFYKTLYPWLMHWLCFDEQAFGHLNRCSYFDNDAKLFRRDFQSGTVMAESGAGA